MNPKAIQLLIWIQFIHVCLEQEPRLIFGECLLTIYVEEKWDESTWMVQSEPYKLYSKY